MQVSSSQDYVKTRPAYRTFSLQQIFYIATLTIL